MRTSWIISFAVVCGVGAFVYVLAVGMPRGLGRAEARGGEPSGRIGGRNMASAAAPYPETIEGLEKEVATGRGPRVGGAWYRLARLYEEADRGEDARRAWAEAARHRLDSARQRPENANAWFEAGWSLWKLGKMDEARPALLEAEKLLSSLPHNRRTDDAWHRLAWSRKLLGQDQDAVIAWSRARDIAAEAPLWNAEALYNLSCYLAQLGEKEGSLTALDRAVAAGWNKAARALHDEDLESIRDDPRFQVMVERMRAMPEGMRVGPG